MPPPRVRPPTPVVPKVPPGAASPCACVAASNARHVAPPPARAMRVPGSTSTASRPERSTTSPPSHTACPATLWPPPRTATGSPCSAAAPSAATTSAVLRQRAIATGLRSTSALNVVRASSYDGWSSVRSSPVKPRATAVGSTVELLTAAEPSHAAPHGSIRSPRAGDAPHRTGEHREAAACRSRARRTVGLPRRRGPDRARRGPADGDAAVRPRARRASTTSFARTAPRRARGRAAVAVLLVRMGGFADRRLRGRASRRLEGRDAVRQGTPQEGRLVLESLPPPPRRAGTGAGRRGRRRSRARARSRGAAASSTSRSAVTARR